MPRAGAAGVYSHWKIDEEHFRCHDVSGSAMGPAARHRVRHPAAAAGAPHAGMSLIVLVLLGLTLPPRARAIEGHCGSSLGDQCFSCTREDGSCTVDEDCYSSDPTLVRRNGGCTCQNPWEGPTSYQPQSAECPVECSEVSDMEECTLLDDCNWNSDEGKCEQNWLGVVVLLGLLVLGGAILGIGFCCKRKQGVPHNPAGVMQTQPQQAYGQMMTVTCPVGVMPGQQIQVQGPSGQPFTVLVPAGVGPGAQFQVQVPGAAALA
jgi:hypothetical protein